MREFGKLFLCAGTILFAACAGTSPGADSLGAASPLPERESVLTGNSKPAKESGSADSLREDSLSNPTRENVPDSATGPASENDVRIVEPESSADAYVEISRIARKALARADSFCALQMMDSVSVIVEQFSVLNPLWEEWMAHVKSLAGKIRGMAAADKVTLERLLVALANANARRADYAEIGTLADTILSLSPGDSLKSVVDSFTGKAYVRTFGKVKSVRDSALFMAREKAAFDKAEQSLTETMMRYPDFADTLRLREALLKVTALRTASATASEEYWKNHDPELSLEEGRSLAEKGKWKDAKEIFEKLKASVLRGEAVRELDSLGNRFCREKRERAASLFAKSKKKKGEKAKLLGEAVESLDSCLEFTPEYRERETVISNKKFLLREIGE